MTVETFNNLPIEEKGKITFGKDASFVGFRVYYGQKLVLYSYLDFFIETYYDPESNEITKIEAFQSDDKKLDRYIDFMQKYEKQPSQKLRNAMLHPENLNIID